MNRRSFITKALAGLAAVPLVGKLAQAREETQHDVALGPVGEITSVWADEKQVYPPKHYAGLIEHSKDGLQEVSAKGYRRVPIREVGEPLQFPIAEEDWGYVTHVAIADSPDGPLLQWFDLHHWSRRTIRAGQITNLDLVVEYLPKRPVSV